MHDKAFFDTNIVLYLYSKDEIKKQTTSLLIVNDCTQAIISTQVVNELINVLSKKVGLEWDEITNVLEEIRESFSIHIVNLAVIQSACKLAKRYQYSYFDSLILASALDSSVTVLFTEDMQNGQIIENRLKIVNPYLLGC
jgi:predicted nucleic acid-binding protein